MDPVNVLQRVSRQLNFGHMKYAPLWLKAVAQNPPSHQSLLKVPHIKTSPGLSKDVRERLTTSMKKRKVSGKALTAPPKLVYPEDALRERFYREHPWELARPRYLAETDGNDHRLADWSKLRQRAFALTGESVVQRTMWLNEKQQMSFDDAYNQARTEFYRARMEDEAAVQVAIEEATFFGTAFNADPIERGIEREQNAIQYWKTEGPNIPMNKIGQLRRRIVR
ncbi:hypothetical protein CANCADRAFT_4350 [Tortispora caseinolytica NRRL Y-17796]|uniref:37S ribosomal protein S25, mitochondrial n=1 Tax=Tortispora caseinolytica NRRL Y-17796 TaxID=767744 RepID=A0A1E4TD80_9ASCO|nr:hypothetical protein CANCADRAFT_4350 [Tortispora caseinolytica NRRL Y-17796]